MKGYSTKCDKLGGISFGRVIASLAKHAGAKMSDHSDRTPDYWIIEQEPRYWVAWDPLNNMDHAMRLACKFRMDINLSNQPCVSTAKTSVRLSELSCGEDTMAGLREAILITAYSLYYQEN